MLASPLKASLMSPNDPQLFQTLEYRTAAAVTRLLPVGLLLIFLGLALLVLADADSKLSGPPVLPALCVALGVGLGALALWRRSNPGKPYISLSPDGVRYRIPWVKEFLIPWNEVKGVETTEIAMDLPWYLGLFAPYYYRALVFRDVTVLLVTKRFYEETIFVDSLFLRGPGWNASFVEKGDFVEVALHHELLSVEPQELRAAVEARWRAFRNRSGGAATRVVATVDAGRGLSRWEWTQIVVLLIGIAAALANIAGLWQLPDQSEARLARTKARAESDYWTNVLRQSEQESREREARSKKREKEFDEMMKRTFGD